MENHIRTIEKFINNELKGEQLQWCKNQLLTNEEFAKQYQLQLEINNAIKERDIIELRKKLKKIYQNQIASEGKVIFGRFTKNFAAAASILMIIGISSLHFLTNRTYTNQKIVQMYYEVYDNYLYQNNIREDSGENLDDLFSQAFKHYDNASYSKALEKFNLILQKEPENTFIMFYTALAEIETGNTENAVAKFKTIIKDKNDLFFQQSVWYLGLCYLKMEETDDAVEIFNQIIQSNHFYKPNAEKILSQLNVK